MNQAGHQIPGVSARLVTIGPKRLEGLLALPEHAAGSHHLRPWQRQQPAQPTQHLCG